MRNEYEEMFFVSKTCANTTRYPLHHHSYWEILCYTKGTGHLLLKNRQQIVFQPGTILCIPPNVDHGSVSDRAFENICICDAGFPLSGLLPGTEICPIMTTDNAAGDITALFHIIHHAYVSDDTDSYTLLMHLMQAVYDFLKIRLQSDSLEKSCVIRLRNYLNDHFTDSDCTVSDAIAACGYTSSYLRAEFKRVTGKTPGQYLRLLRLKNAEFLLTDQSSTETISEIAAKSGFKDALYFSKAFQNAYHTSPTDYRKKGHSRISE